MYENPIHEVYCIVARTSTRIVHTRISIKQVKLQNVSCARVRKYACTCETFFFQRADTVGQ